MADVLAVANGRANVSLRVKPAKVLMFKNIGVVAKPGDNKVGRALATLLDYLTVHGIDIALDESCAEFVAPPLATLETPSMARNRDLIIVVGGDGTLLRAAHLISSYEIPLLGINVGHLGFLTDILPDEIGPHLDAILAGRYEEERRMLLCSEVIRGDRVLQRDYAINDVVIQKWNTARLVTLETYVDGHFVHRQRSDGIIVSTPTGSTAYALSGGGPILQPTLSAISLVPICPHTLSNRPFVIAAQSRIEIVVSTQALDHVRLTCDGEVRCELAPNDRIQIGMADRHMRLIHPAGHDHFATLRAKLQWG
jgi:NAD+ kinase